MAIDSLVEMGVPKPSSNGEWAFYRLPDEFVIPNGTRIQKHGYGCRFKNERVYVDFDFGEHGEINGFDCWRLNDFCRKNLKARYGFDSQKDLERAFEDACLANELTYSGYILWYDRSNYGQSSEA